MGMLHFSFFGANDRYSELDPQLTIGDFSLMWIASGWPSAQERSHLGGRTSTALPGNCHDQIAFLPIVDGLQ